MRFEGVRRVVTRSFFFRSCVMGSALGTFGTTELPKEITLSHPKEPPILYPKLQSLLAIALFQFLELSKLTTSSPQHQKSRLFRRFFRVLIHSSGGGIAKSTKTTCSSSDLGRERGKTFRDLMIIGFTMTLKIHYDQWNNSKGLCVRGSQKENSGREWKKVRQHKKGKKQKESSS